MSNFIPSGPKIPIGVFFKSNQESGNPASGRIKVFLQAHSCAGCGLKIEYAQKGLCRRLHFFGVRGGKQVVFTLDHIRPRSLGGISHLENYCALCEDCNSLKGNSLSLSPKFWVLRRFIEAQYRLQKYIVVNHQPRVDDLLHRWSVYSDKIREVYGIAAPPLNTRWESV